MATKVSVITPVWNSWPHTARHLLQAYQARLDVEFIIIDNGSTDHTPKLLSNYLEKMNNLRVITNRENRGFPIACNQGARKAGGEVLLFLNNDTIVFGDYCSPLLETVSDDILAGPELNSHNTGWNVFACAGAEGVSAKEVTVPYIAGWCLSLTKATYEALGGFDERYTPCDYEDMDLCYTAVKAGKELVRLDLPIRHISGGSAMADRVAITEANRAKFAEKWGLSES
jgi:GT2 family glycosyltransferase